jgi:NAD(P)H-hydrate epimerase
VAIGPGVGTAPGNAKLVLHVAEAAWKAKLPLVVDADGLTALDIAGPKKWKRPASVTVLTPHPGEMSRLTGLPVKEVLQRRMEVARELAE